MPKKEICGFPTDDDGSPCQNPATEDDGHCWIESHSEGRPDGSPDGRGPPEGNDNGLGNDGGAPEGSANAMRHGNYMSFQSRMQYLRTHAPDDEVELFREYYKEYYEKTGDRSASVRLAVGEVFEYRIERNLSEGDLYEEIPVTSEDGTKIKDENGDVIKTKSIKSKDLDALRGFMREVRLGRQSEGVNEDGGRSSSSERSNMWEQEQDGAEAADTPN
jgi:hypothetical protein